VAPADGGRHGRGGEARKKDKTLQSESGVRGLAGAQNGGTFTKRFNQRKEGRRPRFASVTDKRERKNWASMNIMPDRREPLERKSVAVLSLPVITLNGRVRRAIEGSVEPEIGSEKSSEKSSEKILALLKADSELAAREIADTLGISQRAVEKQIAKLREEGRIRRIGPAKGGHWEAV